MVKEIINLAWHFLMLFLPLTIGGLMLIGYYIGSKIGVFNE